MKKNKKHSDFTWDEISFGYDFMQSEMYNLNFKHEIRLLFYYAWQDFKNEKFSYDGATFVKERNKETVFEVAAFIHDWRNSMGYVSYKIDQEFINIMIALNYPWKLILERYLLTRLTFINIIRHKIKNTRKKQIPVNLYQ